MKIDYEVGRLLLDAQPFSKKILIMAGGTGGHVMPALAVAKYLQAKHIQLHWLGTRSGIEANLIPQANIDISFIDIQGFRGKRWRSQILAPWKLMKSLLQSFTILQKEKPNVVLSMGGYVSGPGALVAWLLRIPVVLHEQNAVLGWTNRLLAKFARKIIVAFPNVEAKEKINSKIIHAGNPVREEILNILPPEVRYAKDLKCLQGGEEISRNVRLLVLGGSQGASILNEVVPQALSLLPKTCQLSVWHQSGKNNLVQTENKYKDFQVTAKITDFIRPMAEAYTWADIVICRSGALTIAELSAVGVASILIPFPHAVDDHQTWNAKYLSDKGGAYLLPQSQLTPESLRNLLLELINQPIRRLTVARICRELSRPLATETVAEQCIEVGSEK